MTEPRMTYTEFERNSWLYENKTDEETAELLGLEPEVVRRWRKPKRGRGTNTQSMLPVRDQTKRPAVRFSLARPRKKGSKRKGILSL
jgi:hypothetical protein